MVDKSFERVYIEICDLWGKLKVLQFAFSGWLSSTARVVGGPCCGTVAAVVKTHYQAADK